MPKHLSLTTRCVSICLNICYTAYHRRVQFCTCGSEVNSASANTLCHIVSLGFLQSCIFESYAGSRNILLKNQGRKKRAGRYSIIRTVAKAFKIYCLKNRMVHACTYIRICSHVSTGWAFGRWFVTLAQQTVKIIIFIITLRQHSSKLCPRYLSLPD